MLSLFNNIVQWKPSPDIFSVGFFHLRWYSLFFAIGFGFGYHMMKRICIREGKSTTALDDLLLYLIAGTVIGARLGHCLFYEFDYYAAHPLKILMVWEGGLASHGGGVGVLFAIWLFSRKHRDFALFWIFDRVAIFTSLTGALIRLGNLMNSEIIGKPTDGTWGFVFLLVDKIPRHPTQIYEAICYALIATVGWRIYKKYASNPPSGLIFGATLALIYTARIFLEMFKENQEAFEAGWILNMGQLLSIPYILTGLYFVIHALRNRHRTSERSQNRAEALDANTPYSKKKKLSQNKKKRK